MSDLNAIKDEYSFSVNSIVLSFDDTAWRPDYYAIGDITAYEKLKDKINNSGLEDKFIILHNVAKRINPCANDIPIQCNLLNHRMVIPCPMNFFSDDAYKVIYDGHSIIYATLQLAVYMGFKEIYLLGVDCKYVEGSQNHVKEYTAAVVPNARDLMRGSFKYARQFALKHKINIYDATRGGHLDVFEKVELNKVLTNPKKDHYEQK